MSRTILPFLGSSEPLTEFLGLLERAAESDATLLLTGEGGTGKSAAARFLHARGPRREGPCVASHLAAIAPTLVEAALFGHERGAFTDAHRSRQGLFRKATGGTLVLEDIDLLPGETQVKLLRVLQERVVEPLGSETPVEVDVRVVATTQTDLAAEVEAGRFRQDLYYRVAVVALELPPLRARLDDLGVLVPALIEHVAARAAVAPRPISAAALARLAEHPWPGNARELENALERVLVLVRSRAAPGSAREPIEPEEFAFLDQATDGVAEQIAGSALRHGLTVEVLERAMMERALAEHRGNVSAAARSVGLTRRAFDYRMAQRAAEESA